VQDGAAVRADMRLERMAEVEHQANGRHVARLCRVYHRPAEDLCGVVQQRWVVPELLLDVIVVCPQIGGPEMVGVGRVVDGSVAEKQLAEIVPSLRRRELNR
jgi:hypothetical protein